MPSLGFLDLTLHLLIHQLMKLLGGPEFSIAENGCAGAVLNIAMGESQGQCCDVSINFTPRAIGPALMRSNNPLIELTDLFLIKWGTLIALVDVVRGKIEKNFNYRG